MSPAAKRGLRTNGLSPPNGRSTARVGLPPGIEHPRALSSHQQGLERWRRREPRDTSCKCRKKKQDGSGDEPAILAAAKGIATGSDRDERKRGCRDGGSLD